MSRTAPVSDLAAVDWPANNSATGSPGIGWLEAVRAPTSAALCAPSAESAESPS